MIVELTQGKQTIIDDDCAELIKGYKWYALKDSNKFYATAHFRREDGTWSIIQMHRLLMKTPKGMHTDHINGDGLDNRMSNLRILTCRQNQQNRKNRGYSDLCGVSYHKRDKKFTSTIYIDGKYKRLGTFDDEISAHKAYCRELEILGEELIVPH